MGFLQIHRRTLVIAGAFFGLVVAILAATHFSLEQWRSDVIRSNTSLAVLVAERLHGASAPLMDSLVNSGILNRPLQSIEARRELDDRLKVLSDSVLAPIDGMEGGFYLVRLDDFFGYSYPTSPPPAPAYGPPPRSYQLIRNQVKETIMSGKRRVQLLQFDPAIFPLATEPVDIRGEIVAVVWARTHIEREFPATKLRQVINIGGLLALLGFTVALIISVTQYREIQRMRRDLERVRIGDAQTIEEGKGALGVIANAINIMLRTMRLDNTRREQLERELHYKEKMASLGRVIAGVAHEVKTPLAIIKTRIQMWQHSLRDISATDRERSVISDESLQMVVAEVDRLSALVKRLLEFSKPQPLTLEPTDVAAVLHQTVALLEAHRKKRSIEIITDIPENLPRIRADRSALQQVFINVLMNSFEAIRGTGRISITMQLDGSREVCRVLVHDSGTGIPEELRTTVFDPFITTKKKGFGLGLSISYEIIASHGGTIRLYPHDTVGTVCVIELPTQAARDKST